MENFKNKYYIRLNEKGKIIKVFSEAFEEAEKTDILIGEGYGCQFRVKSEVLSEELKEFADIENGLMLVEENGIYQLKYENGIIKKLSKEEIQAEIDKIPKPLPTKLEVLEKENLLLMEVTAELYEKNLELEAQNLDIMLAVTEIYQSVL